MTASDTHATIDDLFAALGMYDGILENPHRLAMETIRLISGDLLACRFLPLLLNPLRHYVSIKP